MVPIDKEKSQSKPEGYRSIGLLSRSRRVRDNATSMNLKRQYRFHNSQLGFRELTEQRLRYTTPDKPRQNGIYGYLGSRVCV